MPSTSCGFETAPNGLGRQLLVVQGPILQVDIGFDPQYQLQLVNSPNLALKCAQALVDTGATESCIDSDIAMSLNLPIVDQRIISGVSGRQTVNMHLAQIHVPALQFTIFGSFAAVNLAAGGQPHAALIGRTFLQHCVMTYDGTTGEVKITKPSP